MFGILFVYLLLLPPYELTPRPGQNTRYQLTTSIPVGAVGGHVKHVQVRLHHPRVVARGKFSTTPLFTSGSFLGQSITQYTTVSYVTS
jgi:hypothetical protein